MIDNHDPVARLEAVIVEAKRLMAQISILSDKVVKDSETVESRTNKAVAGINEASSSVPKDKVEVRHVWRVDPSTKQFVWSLAFVAIFSFGLAWYLVKSARDIGDDKVAALIQTQQERISELENKFAKPVVKKAKPKNKPKN
jgi:hypothetical protein